MRHVPRFVALLAVAAVTLTSTAGLANAAVSPVSAVAPSWGTYQPVAPARVLDTRSGKGAPNAPIGTGGRIDVTMLGTSGVPATGVSAVVLNVTVTAATRSGYLTVWPAGTIRPSDVSSINFVAGTDRANLVTMPLGTTGAGAGKVSIWNAAGSVEVIADVMGYYLADGATTAGGFYQPLMVPERLLDSRVPGFGGPVLPGEALSVPVSFIDDFDPANVVNANPHIRALAVNITAVSPTRRGYLAAWDGVGAPPATSTLNFRGGTVTPNMAIVPVAPCADCGPETGLPSISVVNESGGTVHFLVDIVGFYDDGKLADQNGLALDGSRFKPMAPTRIVDTRRSLGTTAFKGRGTKSVKPAEAVAGPDTVSLVTNTTAVAPSLPTYLTLWPDLSLFEIPMPVVSNLNAAKGQTVANATITDLGLSSTFTSAFNIFNQQGAVNVLVDVMGTMEYIPTAAPAARLSAPAEQRTWTNKAAQPAR